MKHTDLFYDTPKHEPTHSDMLAAKRLGIPVEAVAYFMGVWEDAVLETLRLEHRPKTED